MTTSRALKPYIHDLDIGLAMRLDDPADRLKAIENDLGAIRARLGERSRIDAQFVAAHTGLTPTQSQIAVMLAEGNTVRDIVLKAGMTENSVRSHIKRIYGKLGVSNQAQVVRAVLMLPPGKHGEGNPTPWHG